MFPSCSESVPGTFPERSPSDVLTVCDQVLAAKHSPTSTEDRYHHRGRREEAKKLEVHKQSLIKSAYRFIQNCQLEAKQCLERAVNRMVYQILNVQNGAYFKLKMYRHGHIESTTAMKVGLFQRIADDLNICSDYLREGDLQIMVREIAIRFARHLQELLIGYSLKPPRVFGAEHDTKHIVEDFEECKKLFYDFGLQTMYIRRRRDTEDEDEDENRDQEQSTSMMMDSELEDDQKAEVLVTKGADTKGGDGGTNGGDGKGDEVDLSNCDLDDLDVDTQHPFYPYFMCVENMKRDTITLMQKHMVIMAKRNEAQKVSTLMTQ